MIGGNVRTGTALTASASLAGLVYAVFQALESSLGDFHPRPTVKLTIAATVFIFGLVLSRLRVLGVRRQARMDRDSQLDSDLAVWPLETVDRVDPYYLGIFPVPAAGDIDRKLGEYVPRDVDDEIAHAVRHEPFVLVFGPPRAGKSRTTYEAARRGLPGAWVIVPEGPDELRTLLEVEPPLDFGPHTAVIWLDDLDRFAPSLDLDLMDAVGGRNQRLKIVATIRQEAYEAMLEAGGQEGETGRRVLTRARGVHLPAKLSAGEEKEAARVFPGHKRGAPLGAGTTELLLGGHAPADPPRGKSSVTVMSLPAPAVTERRWPDWVPEWLTDDLDHRVERHRERKRQRAAERARREDLRRRHVKEGTDVNPRRFTLDVPLTVVVLLFSASGAWMGHAINERFDEPQPPSLEAQLQRDENAVQGTIPTSHAVSLRGPDQKSYLISYRPTERSGSDELRVYDESGGSLGETPELRFHPAPRRDSGWWFVVRNTQIDIDRDGADDIVGEFRLASGSRQTVLPVVIYRRRATKKAGRPGGVSARAARRVEKNARTAPGPYTIKPLLKAARRYRESGHLEDPEGSTQIINAAAVIDFAVVEMNDTIKLLIGTQTRAGHELGFVSLVQVDAFLLGTDQAHPADGLPCIAYDRKGERHIVQFHSAPGPLAPQLIAQWRIYDATSICRDTKPAATR